MKVAKLWHLEKFDLMKKLSKQEIMRIADGMHLGTFHKNTDIIFPEKENKSVYFLKHGMIKIGRITESGDEDWQYLIRSGNIFGELALADGEDPNLIAVAVEDSLICELNIEKMRGLMEENKKLNNEVIKLMGLRVRKVERRLESILFKDSQTRIIEFLVDYFNEFGEGDNGKVTARNSLTHKDIAKLTATSRQTVNAVLNQLRAKGLLDYDSREMWLQRSNIDNMLRLTSEEEK